LIDAQDKLQQKWRIIERPSLTFGVMKIMPFIEVPFNIKVNGDEWQENAFKTDHRIFQ
jgi:hypothetical protein